MRSFDTSGAGVYVMNVTYIPSVYKSRLDKPKGQSAGFLARTKSSFSCRGRVVSALEKASERAQDVPDGLVHRVYTRPEDEGRLHPIPADIGEAWRDGQIAVHLHIGRRSIESEQSRIVRRL